MAAIMPPTFAHGEATGGLKSKDVLESVSSEIENLSALLQEKDANAADINIRLSKLRSHCERTVTEDIRYAFESKVEDTLWNFHVKSNSWYRDHFKALKRHERHVEERKLSKRYLEFIKSGQRFYRDHIQKLAVQHGGIPELEAVALKMSVEELEDKYNGLIQPELRPVVLESCFYALIRLGDLSRWREQLRIEGEANWDPAIGFYDLASTIRPESGFPHNQLAVVAAAKKDTLRVILHFYRALTAKDPHPTAEKNLDLEFKKIMFSPIPRPATSGYLPGEPKQILENLIRWFAHLHGKCRQPGVLSEVQELEHRVIGYLTVNTKDLFMPWILMQICLINHLAEYAACQQAKAQPTLHLFSQARGYFTKLNVKVFTALLNVLQQDVLQLRSQTDWPTQPVTDRVSPIMRRVLPGLRLYSCWLVWCFPTLTKPLPHGTFHEVLRTELRRMWNAYAKTLNVLTETFAPEACPIIEYLLEEDSETLGFIPYQSSDFKHRFLDSNMSRKPDRHSVPRNHPTEEMLGRVRDMVSDGIEVAQKENAPVAVERDEESGRPVFRYTSPDSLKPTKRGRDGSVVSSPTTGNTSVASAGTSITSPTPSTAGAGPAHPPPPAVPQAPRPPTPNTLWRLRVERMVDDLVGPDTTPRSFANYPGYPPYRPGVDDGSARPRTPPSRYFEDPRHDVNPLTSNSNASGTASGNEENLADTEAMRWLNENVEAGKLEGRMDVGDPYYRVRPE